MLGVKFTELLLCSNNYTQYRILNYTFLAFVKLQCLMILNACKNNYCVKFTGISRNFYFKVHLRIYGFCSGAQWWLFSDLQSLLINCPVQLLFKTLLRHYSIRPLFKKLFKHYVYHYFIK